MNQSSDSSKKTRKNKNRNKKTRRAKSNFIANILNTNNKAEFVKFDPNIDVYKLTDRDREIIRRFRQTDDKVKTGLEDDTDNIKISDPSKKLKPELKARFFPKGNVKFPPDNKGKEDKVEPVDWENYNKPILNARFLKQWITVGEEEDAEDKDTSLLKAKFLKDKNLKAKFIEDTDTDSDYDSDSDSDDDTEDIYKAPYIVSDKVCRCICDNYDDAFKMNQTYRYKKQEKNDSTFYNLSDRMKYVKLPQNQQRNYWSSVNRTNAYHENYLNAHFFNK